ncbi:MYND finger domain-containing protein [Sarocladium implicatum]|nr:MYND finger domain-containing protein [Sarocladium implicatum]
MGRWGRRLFEGDQDLDVACDLNNALDGIELDLSAMIHQTDMLAPENCRQFYKTPEYQPQLAESVAKMCKRLDSGLGDRLMAYCRARESDKHFPDPKYRTIIAGALMMRAGAKIKPEDIQHLRDLVPQINCNFGYALPFCDEGFRHAGKVQFLAALDHYTPGTPRNYQEPSCFTCGKVEADTGATIKKCQGCEWAWYCSKDCQRKQWKKHKPMCGSPKPNMLGFVSLNV